MISDENFKRIFYLIYSILKYANPNRISKNCMYYTLMGTAILREHFDLDANPVFGSAIVKTCHEDVLTFGTTDNNRYLISNIDAFHGMIQVDNILIDFMSPLYNLEYLDGGITTKCDNKIFIKYINEISSNFNKMKEGEFYFERNQEIVNELIHIFYSNVLNKDMIKIALHYFNKEPAKFIHSIPFYDTKYQDQVSYMNIDKSVKIKGRY